MTFENFQAALATPEGRTEAGLLMRQDIYEGLLANPEQAQAFYDSWTQNGQPRMDAAPVRTGWNRPGVKAMVIGFGISAVGIIITVATLAAASRGGTYLVLWGAIIFGAVQGVRGIIQFVRGQ